MKKVVLWSLLAIFACSCAVSTPSLKRDSFELFKTTSISDYVVFQTAENGEFGLATNPYNGMVIAVRSSSLFFPLYYQRAIKGMVIMIDTYSYETVPDEQGRTKRLTVPVVVPYREIKNKQKEIE